MLRMSEDIQQEVGWNEMISFSDPFKLLSMATEFEKAGVITYAITLYTKVLDKYPDTFEAVAAKLALFLIAGRFESEGKKNMAISLVRRISTNR